MLAIALRVWFYSCLLGCCFSDSGRDPLFLSALLFSPQRAYQRPLKARLLCVAFRGPFQMNLQSMSDQNLIESTERAVACEREQTGRVLEHLRELERRRLFVKLGYSSVYDYCTRALKYCPASAQLRIDAMRVTHELPEVKEALEAGSVSLSSVGVLQKFIRTEKSKNGNALSTEEKRKLFDQIQHQSKEETERTLAAISPHVVPEERIKTLTPETTEIRLVANQALMELISEMRAKLRHKGNSDAGMAEIFEYALKKALGHVVSDRRKAASSDEVPPMASVEVQPITSPGEVKFTARKRRPYIPRSTHRALDKKTGRQCTFVSPITGLRCQATHALQIEHIQPFAFGGSDNIANLTLLCPAHNRLRAIQSLGEAKMKRYLGD